MAFEPPTVTQVQPFGFAAPLTAPPAREFPGVLHRHNVTTPQVITGQHAGSFSAYAALAWPHLHRQSRSTRNPFSLDAPRPDEQPLAQLRARPHLRVELARTHQRRA
eukprot:5344216-Prymnesium_polylepis.1